MKYRDKLIKYFEDAPEGAVIVANDMYENGFTKMSHDAFFRAVERLCDDGVIIRAGKGMYIKAADKDKNIEELLLNYFFGENNDNGLFIGYRLYNKYMVSAYQTDRIELYSNVLKSRTCEVGNICVKRPGVQLDFENARVIEALEIAFMKKVLDMYKVENSLQQYLSYASDYKVPAVQRVARL